MSPLLITTPLLCLQERQGDAPIVTSTAGGIPDRELLLRYRDAIDATLLLPQSLVDFANEAYVNASRFREEEPKRAPKTVRIYLMRNNRNGYTKIGTSASPRFREKTLQAEDPDITMIHQSSRLYSISDERAIHNHFQEKRIRGEWFNLSVSDVERAKEMAK